MGLFTVAEMSELNDIAKKSNKKLENTTKPAAVSKKGDRAEIERASELVEEYFKDSPALLIDNVESLHEYIDKCIEAGYTAIDTETTGLDRIYDTIVGCSLYYPGGVECYIPNKHLIHIFNEPYKDQLTYEETGKELQRLVDAKVKMIFANADFDLSMIYKDYKVDMCDVFFYDTILAWRCIKENEVRNGLKELYSKYVLGGKGDPKKFTDFFSPRLFPYSKPKVAKLYAANDAKITYDLFAWQLPYIIPSNKKCQANKLERIADIVWNLEFPMVKVCAMMHRNGVYFDQDAALEIGKRYHSKYDEELSDLQKMVQDLIDDLDTPNNRKRPFKTGFDFNPTSPKHVSYLCYDLLKLPNANGGTGKEILREFALPQTDKILKVRSLSVLINTFIDKLTNVSYYDHRIHPQFKGVGADTGRMSCIAKGQMISCPGGDKPIEEIEPGDYVYCYDVNTNKLNISTVEGRYLTGIRKCVKIDWISKYNHSLSGSLICTPDHFLRTQDGRWVMAQDLKPEDSLLYVHRRVQEDSIALYAAFGQRNEEEHVWIKEYKGYLGKDYVIHHLDKNRNNNSPDNLVICEPNTHQQIHLSNHDGYNHSLTYTRDELYSLCDEFNWELRNIPHDYGTLIKWLRQYRINYLLEYLNSYSRRSYTKTSNERYYKRLHSQMDIGNCRYALDLADGNLTKAASYFGIAEDEFTSVCNKHKLLDNHSIVSIEWLEDSYEVYDLCISNYHNFIASELCVHNSSDPNCISKGTKISCVGEFKNIEDIEVGDLVYCYDKNTGNVHKRRVLNKWNKGMQDCIRVVCSNSNNGEYEELILTPDHRVLDFDGLYIEARNLNTGHKLFSSNYQVISMEPVGSYEVFDIEVEEYHNFIANGICVSNCQNIPSHATDIRHMFRATSEQEEIIELDNEFKLPGYDFVETSEGFKEVMNLQEGDSIKFEDGYRSITSIVKDSESYIIAVA